MKMLMIVGISISLLTSCGLERSAASGWDNSSSDSYYANDVSSDIQARGPKIIKSSTLYLTVKSPDSANVRIAKIATQFNGYVKENGTTMSIIRVEAKYLDSVMNLTGNLGTITGKYITGKDVTEDYADFEIRLSNAELARKRYLELLARAENVEAALKVEKELERLNETIELMKGKMNRMDHLVAYSTITIYLKEKKKPGVIGYIGVGLYKAIKWLFVRN
jgi:chemotaxis protein histidine kinase CheA